MVVEFREKYWPKKSAVRTNDYLDLLSMRVLGHLQIANPDSKVTKIITQTKDWFREEDRRHLRAYLADNKKTDEHCTEFDYDRLKD